MADTVTTTLGLTKPEVGASEDSWGEKINTNFDLVDDALDGTTAVSLDIDGGTIDGAVIGGATPAAITGTAITGTSFATSGDMTFGDNDKAIFGAGSDLEIYHDGSNSYIADTGTGRLRLRGNDRVDIYSGDGTKQMAKFVDGAEVALYNNNALKLATTSTGISVTGNATFADNGKAIFGAGSDLQIYHDTVNSYIDDTGAGNLVLRGNSAVSLQKYTGETLGVFNADGPVNLFYDNAQKFATTATGVDITGVLTTDGISTSADVTFGDNDKAIFGAGSDLQIYHDAGGDSYITESNASGQLRIQAGNIKIADADGNNFIYMTDLGTGGLVNLFHNGSEKLATTATGIDVTGTVTADGLTVDGDVLLNGDRDLHLVGANPNAGSSFQYGEVTFGDASSSQYSNHAKIIANGNYANQSNLEFHTSNNNSSPLRMKISEIGDISFYEDTGTTPKFFWDASAESLGIGTSSPSGKLHVESNDASQLSLTRTGVGTYGIGVVSGDALIFQDGSTERLRIDSSGMLNAYYGISVDGGTIKLDGNYPVGTDNVALGNAALDDVESGGIWNVAIGTKALTALTTGDGNTAVGRISLETLVTGSNNTALGYAALQANTAGNNTAVGYQAGFNNTTASGTTAIGHQAGYSNTTGVRLTALGLSAGLSNTTGGYNTALGYQALKSNQTGESNVSVGENSMYYNTGSFNTAVGRTALLSNTTANYNTAVGYQAGYDNTTGVIDAFGASALANNTTGNYNTAIGGSTLFDNTTGSNNVAVGRNALENNTTASENTAVGYEAGYTNSTASYNTALGFKALKLSTAQGNTAVGREALAVTTGAQNTAIGFNAGQTITTGAKNTILGTYNGNQGGLDIRTGNNNIVLSDGDGNPRMFIGSTGRAFINTFSSLGTNPARLEVYETGGARIIQTKTDSNSNTNHLTFNTPSGQAGYIYTNTLTTSYVTSSDYRLKENVVDLTGATDRLKQLEPKRFNFIADADTTVDGFLAHEVQAIVPEAISGQKDATKLDEDGNTVPNYQGIDQSKLVPLLVATIKELEARITALENA